MPELPDLTVYAESLAAKVRGAPLRRVRVLNAFVLRTAVPPIAAAEGRVVDSVDRMGKRIVIALSPAEVGSDSAPAGDELFIVIHLMLAGRLRWAAAGAKPRAQGALAHFEFDAGTLTLTEAGTRRRASIHLAAGRKALQALDAGGLEVLTASPEAFAAQLRAQHHTLKRALAEPGIFSGIGNAYSDEILHRAKLSPLALAHKLDGDGVQRLFDASRTVLADALDRLRAEAAAAGGWPKEVTAFRPEFAVHGRFKQPCPVCGSPVQRIVRGDRESNYCARCQTDGRLLADRALSRLLHDSWPRHLDDLD